MNKWLKKIIVICILLLPVGCAVGKDNITGASTNFWHIVPGHRSRRLNRLEYQVDVAELQKRREQLRYETEEIRRKYDKLQ